MNFILQMKSMVNFFFLLTKQAQNKTIKTYLRIRQTDKARAQCNTIQALYSSIWWENSWTDFI